MARSNSEREFFDDPSDGLPVEVVKDWFEQKHQLLRMYCEVTAPARAKWPYSAYVDLFSGYGKSAATSCGEVQDAGPLVALRAARRAGRPFTHTYVNDLSKEAIDACSERLRRAGFDVSEVYTERAEDAVHPIARSIPKGSLSLAFLDPFNIGSLPFSVISKLASVGKMDMLVHLSVSDIHRNFNRYDRGESSHLDHFAPGWREKCPPNTSLDQRRRLVLEHWYDRVEGLGYERPTDLFDVTAHRNQQLYKLVLISRHPLGSKLWKACLDATSHQRELSF